MVELTKEEMEKLVVLLQQNNNSKKNETKDLWVRACKYSNDVLDLYDSGYDKKELGKRPEKEMLVRVIFSALLKHELNRVLASEEATRMK